VEIPSEGNARSVGGILAAGSRLLGRRCESLKDDINVIALTQRTGPRWVSSYWNDTWKNDEGLKLPGNKTKVESAVLTHTTRQMGRSACTASTGIAAANSTAKGVITEGHKVKMSKRKTKNQKHKTALHGPIPHQFR